MGKTRDIRAAVQDELIFAPLVDSSDIRVENGAGALDRNALITNDRDVVVDTDAHTVTLSSYVRSWAEHDVVIGAAWMTPAVCDVYDQLDVTG